MKSETPRTDTYYFVDRYRPPTFAETLDVKHARKLELELNQWRDVAELLAKELKELNRLASLEISEYQTPIFVTMAEQKLEQLQRIAVMPNEKS